MKCNFFRSKSAYFAKNSISCSVEGTFRFVYRALECPWLNNIYIYIAINWIRIHVVISKQRSINFANASTMASATPGVKFLPKRVSGIKCSHRAATLLKYYGKSLEALPGVAYPGFRDNCSTLNTKTGYKKTQFRHSIISPSYYYLWQRRR